MNDSIHYTWFRRKNLIKAFFKGGIMFKSVVSYSKKEHQTTYQLQKPPRG